MPSRLFGQSLKLLPVLVAVLIVGQAFLRISAHDYPFVTEQGDYWRIAGPAGLRPLIAPMNGQPLIGLEPHPIWHGGFSSSAPVFIQLAKLLSEFWSGGRGFLDIRAIGATYLAVLALPALFLFQGARPRERWLLVLGLWAGTDPLMLAYLNSLYGDPPILVATCLTFMALARLDPERPPQISFLVVLLFAAAVGALSKPQYAVLPGLILASLFLSRPRAWLLGSNRRLAGTFAAALLLSQLVALDLMVWRPGGANEAMKDSNSHDRIYLGITRFSARPNQTLARLGVHERYWLKNQKEPPAWNEPGLRQVVRSISLFSLLGAYLRDWTTWIPVATRIEDTLIDDRLLARAHVPVIGSFYQFRKQLYSIVPHLLWILLPISLLHGVWARSPLFLFLGISWFCHCTVAIVGDGLMDLKRHLLGARMSLDLLLPSVGLLGIARLGPALALASSRARGHARRAPWKTNRSSRSSER